MSNKVKTFCRNCTSHCGLEFEVDNDCLVSVRGDANHAMTGGYFCVKANMSVDLGKGDQDRLTQCQKRSEDDSFVPVTAVDAVDEIGERISELVSRYGPRSVGIFYGTGSYLNGLSWPLMKSFLCELGSPNLFSTMTIDQSARWVAMLRMGTMASGAYSPAEVDTLLIVGKNPLVSHQLIGFFRPGKSLVELRERGADVILVDPRATETARHASLHLAVKPGEDVTLFAGMIRLILDKGWQDEDFCHRFVDGVEALREAVEGYTPDYVRQRSGITAEQLLNAAEKFALAPKSLAVVGTGPCMGPHSNLAVHLVECLNALCGNFNRAGDRIDNQSVLFPRPFVETAISPNRSWETGVQCHSASTGQLFGEFPTGALPDEILTPGENRIRALIVLGGNPVTAIGQPEKTLRAFADLDLLVTIDPRMTETARMSHYVIAPKLQYERHDLSTVMDGITGYTRPFVQYTAPVVTHPPGTVDEGEFFWQLAQRLDLQLVYKKMILGMDYNAIAEGHGVDMERMPDGEQLASWWCEGTALEFDTLKSRPGGVLVEMPDTQVQSAPDNAARMSLCPDDVAIELAQVLDETAVVDYPYRLVTRRLLECLNSLYRDSAQTRRRYPSNYAYMHPDDIAREGITAGDSVQIRSAYGAISALVRPDRGLAPAVVSMAHQWGDPDVTLDPDGNKGAFTGRLVSLDHEVESINRMPRQTAIPVKVSVARQ
jgi:anaerobic selenocysteine-containing dehydrogenase